MSDETFLLGDFDPPKPSPMYGRRPTGEGTGDVESLFSHFLGLAHDHRLTPKNVVNLLLPEVMAQLPATQRVHLGWGWDKHSGKEMIGLGQTAGGWVSILSHATNQSCLANSTLLPLAPHVFGDLTTNEERICIHCMASDVKEGRLPHGRLLWRMRCVSCCPIHLTPLTKPNCGRPRRSWKQLLLRVMLSGVCRDCGSIGYACNSPDESTPSAAEVWRAEQCRRMIAAFPAIARADQDQMRACIKEHCRGRGALTSLAIRSGATISVLSRWLNTPTARLSFDQILDICGTEGLELAALLQGKAEPTDLSGTPVPPMRVKRVVRPADHLAIRDALEAAAKNGSSVTAVAEQLRVDIATLAQHKELYAAVRTATRIRKDAQESARQDDAIARAEAAAMKLLKNGLRLTPRNAQTYAGEHFYPSSVGWTVLTLIRIGLGDRSVRHPSGAYRMSASFLAKIDAAAKRIREAFGETQQALQLDYR